MDPASLPQPVRDRLADLGVSEERMAGNVLVEGNMIKQVSAEPISAESLDALNRDNVQFVMKDGTVYKNQL